MSLRESDVFAPPKPKPKRRTRAADRESAVVRECLLWLRRYGALVIRSHSGLVVLSNGYWMKQGMAGWPDICGVLPDGRFVAVECKARRGGRQSAAQKRIEQEIRDRNGVYIRARSAEDIQNGITDANRELTESQHCPRP